MAVHPAMNESGVVARETHGLSVSPSAHCLAIPGRQFFLQGDFMQGSLVFTGPMAWRRSPALTDVGPAPATGRQ